MAFQLEIVTPEARAWHGPADSIVLPTATGEVGLLPAHRPLVTLVVPGEITVTHGGKTEALAVDRGFARVSGNAVTVLTEAAIDVTKIDEKAVEEARARAEKALAEAKASGQDESELEAFEQVVRFSIAQQLSRGKRR